MTNPIRALYEQVDLERAANRKPKAPPRLRRIQGPVTDRVDRHPAGTYLISTQTEMSRSTALSALSTAARLLGEEDIKSTPWHLIRYYQMNMLRAMLAEHYAPATANKILSIVRGVLRQAWKLGLMTTDDYERAISVPAIPGTRLPAGRALERGEIHALFHACAEPGPLAARDAALLAILLGCGLRRSEAAGLDIDDLDIDAATLRVIGKGNHERVAHMNGSVATAVAAWLDIRGDGAGPLLCAMEGRGQRVGRNRLTTEGMRLVLKRRAEQAGIRSCTPHDLRRTFITTLLDEGNDIAVASRMAGHRNIATTARYDRRDERTNRDAAATIHVPYQPPVVVKFDHRSS